MRWFGFLKKNQAVEYTMASEVTKVSVVDSRILQSKPKFAVEKGPLSLTNVPYRAITATSSQQTFNIIVPSESVFVDRAVDWSTWVYGQMDVTTTGAFLAAGEPICVYGRDVALAPYPLHQLCATMSATINDTTTVVNTSDVLTQLLRLQDYKKHRKVKTCPSMLDRYLTYPADARQVNSPLNGFEAEANVDEKPNGSWGQFQWTNATGGVPSPNAVDEIVTPATGLSYLLRGGVPVSRAANLGPGVYRLFFRFRSTERLLISPFIFADDHQISTGLFGVQNIQLLMNFLNPAAGGRLIRSCGFSATNRGTISLANVGFNATFTGASAPFENPQINIQYLTPSLDVPLPAKSIVPYMDYPRYISQPAGTTIAPTLASDITTSTGIQSQTITLPAIPDLLIIYVRPQSITATNVGDYLLPITNISVNFDNFAGLLSSHSQEQLYRMSVQNGLEMDWDQWRGYASYSSSAGALTPTSGTGAAVGAAGYQSLAMNTQALTGGPLVLKPGRDIVLQAGQAPSLVGNFTLQFNLQVQNFTNNNVANAQVYVIAVNSGYFETIKGSSRIIKGVLTEQDILSAPLGPGSSEAHMGRFVGAGMISDNAEEAHKHADNGRGRGRGSGRGNGMSAYY